MVEVWPDNAHAVGVVLAISTQWRVGSGGPVGLDYSQLDRGFWAARVPRRRRREVFADVQVIEEEALRTFHDN